MTTHEGSHCEGVTHRFPKGRAVCYCGGIEQERTPQGIGIKVQLAGETPDWWFDKENYSLVPREESDGA